MTRPVVSRALRVAAVMSTVLVAINQGEVIPAGVFTFKTATQNGLT